jgi:hypothetical protein
VVDVAKLSSSELIDRAVSELIDRAVLELCDRAISTNNEKFTHNSAALRSLGVLPARRDLPKPETPLSFHNPVLPVDHHPAHLVNQLTPSYEIRPWVKRLPTPPARLEQDSYPPPAWLEQDCDRAKRLPALGEEFWEGPPRPLRRELRPLDQKPRRPPAIGEKVYRLPTCEFRPSLAIGKTIRRIPVWLDQQTQLEPGTKVEASQQGSRLGRHSLLALLQVFNTILLGVAVYVGVSGWLEFAKHPSPPLVAASALPPAPAIAATPSTDHMLDIRAPKVAQSVPNPAPLVPPSTAPVIATNSETPEALHSAGAVQTPLVLSDDQMQLIRDHIKMPPAPSGAPPTISVGDVLPPAKLIPVPRSLSDKIPTLVGARFTTDKNNAIIIARGADNRVDLVVPPK